MLNLPHRIENFKWNFENVAFIFYLISVAATVLGPVVHYIGWSVALIALLYGKVWYGASLAIHVPKESKPAFYTLLLFSFWCMFPNIINSDSFYIWGKGASVYLELLLGVYFAMRLVTDEPKRRYMLLAIVMLNTVFSVGYIISYYFPFYMPNKSIMHGNSLGGYATVIMPFIIWCSFAQFKGNNILKLVLCGINAIIILISMSSGAWLTALTQGLILLYFIIAKKFTKISTIICYILLIIAAAFAFDIATDGRLYRNFQIESQQAESINDIEKLTTARYDIWRAALYISKQHPFIGRGYASFEDDYAKKSELFVRNIPDFKIQNGVTHVHNIYLHALYAGGVPALILFLVMMCLLIAVSVRAVKSRHNEMNFWGVLCFAALVGCLAQGVGGDVFQGRRDIATIFWFTVAMTIMLPSIQADKELIKQGGEAIINENN